MNWAILTLILSMSSANYVNLGDYISRNIQLKISKYLISPSLHSRLVINFEAKDFEEFKKYLEVCKVKMVEGSEYTLFLDEEEK